MPDLSKPGKTHRSEEMRELAKVRDDLPANWHQLADDLDAATVGFNADPPTHDVRQLLAAIARARIAWCAATGEALV